MAVNWTHLLCHGLVEDDIDSNRDRCVLTFEIAVPPDKNERHGVRLKITSTQIYSTYTDDVSSIAIVTRDGKQPYSIRDMRVAAWTPNNMLSFSRWKYRRDTSSLLCRFGIVFTERRKP